ncbi:MAG: putative S-layer protein [Candidatus Woesearchaeota archaeon]
MSLKNFIALFVFIVAVAFVSAVPVEIEKVKIDGDEITSIQDDPDADNILSIERDQEFEVKVEVRASADVRDAQIEVVIRGYDSDEMIEDITDVFDMKANRTYIKKLNLRLPVNADKDLYRMRVRVDDRDGDTTQEDYRIEITATRHAIQIKDVIFSPEKVMAGRSLLATVRLKNVGAVDEKEGVKVQVSIPELGVSAADYIDEVDEDDSVTSEELYLRIPACVKEGTYDVEVAVVYKDGERVTRAKDTILITKGDGCEPATPTQQEQPQTPKTIITMGPSVQDVTKGQGGVIYPFTITNAGKESKTYVLTVDGYSDWADIRMTPANIMVIQPGETKAAYLYLSAKDTAAVGEHMFTVTITSGGETLKEVALKSIVHAGQTQQPEQQGWPNIRKGLEIALLVLVVLLVIVGLIIGFSKMRGKEEEAEEGQEETKSYY